MILSSIFRAFKVPWASTRLILAALATRALILSVFHCQPGDPKWPQKSWHDWTHGKYDDLSPQHLIIKFPGQNLSLGLTAETEDLELGADPRSLVPPP